MSSRPPFAIVNIFAFIPICLTVTLAPLQGSADAEAHLVAKSVPSTGYLAVGSAPVALQLAQALERGHLTCN